VRVGLVCPYAWDVPGGVMAHVRDLAEALLAEGHRVSVLTPRVDGDAPLPGYAVDAGRPVPIPYNGSVARLLLGPVSYTRVRRWVRAGIDGAPFDVLHVHEPTAPSVALLACYVASGPIVGTFHTSNVRSRLLSAAEPLLTPALEKVRARIAVSPAARRTIVEHLGGDAVEIPNGVAVRRFAAAEPWPSYDGVPTVAFVGRIDEPRKGLGTLLAAWPLLRTRGARLLVAGPGEPPANVPPGVELLGTVSEGDKARLYRTAAVYCAPNLGGESFGIVLLEAMAAGAAVVASDLEAFRRVLAGGRAGLLVPPGQPAALAATLDRLLGDGPARDRLRTAGAEEVVRYDWPRVARSVVEVYETVRDGDAVLADGALPAEGDGVDLVAAEQEPPALAPAPPLR